MREFDAQVGILYAVWSGDRAKIDFYKRELNYTMLGLKILVRRLIDKPAVYKEAALLMKWRLRNLPKVYYPVTGRYNVLKRDLSSELVVVGKDLPYYNHEMNYGTIDYSKRYSYEDVKKESPRTRRGADLGPFL